MRCFAVLLTLLFFGQYTVAQVNYTDFPTYEEVQNHFVSHYKSNLIHSSSKVVFEKRKDGYYIRQVEYFPEPHTILFEQLWSAEEKQYQYVGFERRNNPKSLPTSTHDDDELYNLLPYFGYNGWEADINRDFKSDSSIYGLRARILANMSLAFNAFNNEIFEYDTIGENDTLTVVEFNNYLYDAILTITALNHLDRDYIIQGKKTLLLMDVVRLKGIEMRAIYYGGYVSTYEHEKFNRKGILYQDDRKVLFDTSFLVSYLHLPFYRNMLLSCPDSSVLVVSGDLDNLVLNFVKNQSVQFNDITVLNLDQLGNPRYRDYITSQGNQLFSELSDELNEQDIRFIRVLRYVPIRQRQLPGESLARQKVLLDGLPDNQFQIEDFDLAQEYSQLRDLMQFVVSDLDNQLDNGLTRYKYFPTHGVRCTLDSLMLEWKIPFRSLNQMDLVLLDVILHVKSRPLVFASTTPEDFYLGIPHEQLRGLVRPIVGKPELILSDQEERSVFETYDLLLRQFDLSRVEEISPFVFETYAGTFQYLIRELSRQEKYQGALSATRFYFEKFPVKSWKSVVVPLDLVEYLFILDDQAGGNRVLDELWKVRFEFPREQQGYIINKVTELRNRYRKQ